MRRERAEGCGRVMDGAGDRFADVSQTQSVLKSTHVLPVSAVSLRRTPPCLGCQSEEVKCAHRSHLLHAGVAQSEGRDIYPHKDSLNQEDVFPF